MSDSGNGFLFAGVRAPGEAPKRAVARAVAGGDEAGDRAVSNGFDAGNGTETLACHISVLSRPVDGDRESAGIPRLRVLRPGPRRPSEVARPGPPSSSSELFFALVSIAHV
jgi:hypothetical protein